MLMSRLAPMAVVAGVPRPRFAAHMWPPLAGGIAGVGAVVGSRAGVMHGPRTLGACLERKEAGARVMWVLPPRGACSALSVDLARNGPKRPLCRPRRSTFTSALAV